MTALTITAALAIASACAPGVDPTLLVGFARQESGLDPAAVHLNPNGTVDRGMWQINSANLGLLHITAADTFDPCKAAAAAALLLQLESRYNTGSPTAGLTYARRVTASVRAVKAPGAIDGNDGHASLPRPRQTAVFARPVTGSELVFASSKY